MRAHAFRLTPGTDLRAELRRLTEEHALRAGCILSCVGSLSHARLRMPGAVGDSTTRAVVAGIVLVLIADGVFGVLFYYLRI